MTIEHGVVYSFPLELAKGTHDFSADTIQIALYEETASLTLSGITAYTSAGEISGTGYTTGGYTLTKATGFPKRNETAEGEFAAGQVTIMDFEDLSVPNLVATARAALIYNISKSNKAIAILDFGKTHYINGNFILSFPTASALNPIIRIS